MRGRSSSRARATAVAVAVGVIAVVASTGAGSAATTSKPYVASITPTSTPEAASQGYAYTIANRSAAGVSNEQSLGSADVLVPPGWGVSGLSAKAYRPNGTLTTKSWSAGLSSGRINVRSASSGDRLAGGEYVVVSFTGTAPAIAGCLDGQGTWTPVVKQSNNFNGSGNDFSLDPASPTRTVTIEAGPGDLGSFVVDPVADPQVAGDPFDVRATAYDTCGAVKTDYTGGAAVSDTLADSPNGTPPTYGAFGTWSGGSATASVTAVDAAAGQVVTVSHGTVSGSSNAFTVDPAALDSIAFAQQPTTTQVGSTIDPAVTVSGVDEFGNRASGTIDVAIGVNPGGGTLGGTTSAALVDGLATFSSLTIDTIGLGYTLVARSGTLDDTSASFDVVTVKCVNDDSAPCVAETPPGGNTSSRVEVADSPTLDGAGTLYLALDPSTVVACGGSFQIGTTVVLQPTGFDQQSRAVMRIQYDKSQAPGVGVANYVFCFDKGVGTDSFEPARCPKKITAAAGWCEVFRKRTDAGDLLVEFNGPVQDPRVTGFG